MMGDFRVPFLLDIVKGGGDHNGEADEKDVCLRVGQRSEPVIVFLPGSVEQTKGVWFVADHDGNCVVVENSGDVVFRELVARVRDEKTRLPNCTIADHDTFDSIGKGTHSVV